METYAVIKQCLKTISANLKMFDQLAKQNMYKNTNTYFHYRGTYNGLYMSLTTLAHSWIKRRK